MKPNLSDLAAIFDATSPARCPERRDHLVALVRKGDFAEAFAVMDIWDQEGWLGEHGYFSIYDQLLLFREHWPNFVPMT